MLVKIGSSGHVWLSMNAQLTCRFVDAPPSSPTPIHDSPVAVSHNPESCYDDVFTSTQHAPFSIIENIDLFGNGLPSVRDGIAMRCHPERRQVTFDLNLGGHSIEQPTRVREPSTLIKTTPPSIHSLALSTKDGLLHRQVRPLLFNSFKLESPTSLIPNRTETPKPKIQNLIMSPEPSIRQTASNARLPRPRLFNLPEEV